MTRASLTILLISAVLGLSACKSGEGASQGVGTAPQGAGQPTGQPGGAESEPDVLADALGGWFVREFDNRALEQIRNTVAFTAQNIRYTLVPPRGSGVSHDRDVSSNAFRDIGVDYARSVGLTGKGVTVSVVDSPVNVGHSDFKGKTVIAADTPLVLDEGSHGTGVAGLAVGKNGVAPGANLHHAPISFKEGMKLSTLAAIMRDAAAHGALVSNNSWALTATVQANRDGSLLSDYASGRDYLQSLREFTSDGIVVFAVSNSYSDRSAHLMAGLPVLYPELEQGWLAVINAIPTRRGGRVESAIRVSAACLEAARWCIAANGQAMAPSSVDLEGYDIAKGASFAAPQISGALALLAEAFPDLTPAELRARLLVTADNSFFAHDGVVEFGPGLSHGYSDEWGHGFADLRAALLPIGKITTPRQNGSAVDIGDAVAVAGTAMGDAPSRALAMSEMIVNDQMLGVFAVPAGSMVKPRDIRPKAPMSTLLARTRLDAVRAAGQFATAGNMTAALHFPGTIAESGSFSVENAYEVNLATTEQYRLSAIMSGASSATAGLSASTIFTGETAGLELGFEAIREAGSVIGMQAARSGAPSRHIAVTAEAALSLGQGAVLRLGGKIGRASGAKVGEMITVGDQTFDSLTASISVPNVAKRGDVLTFFANQPVAVRSGSAVVSLAHPTATGDIRFSQLSVDTAPSSRQVDLGFDYLRPLGAQTDIAISGRHILNEGNIAGRNDTEIGFRISLRF